MTSTRRNSTDIPLHIRNEAAAWIMQLHALDRTPNTDAALRRWLAQSAGHREAFEIASDMWNAAGTLPVSILGRLSRKPSWPYQMWRMPLFASVAAVLVCLVVAVVAVYRLHGSELTTAVGEQRTLMLEDGTRVALNTATNIAVAYDKRARRLTLESGEALFEVARDPQRPFIVKVANREVTALGTSFVIRRDDAKVSVTLVEGKVSVADLQGPRLEPIPIEVLSPGERLTFTKETSSVIDRPSVERVTAWRTGHVAFIDTPLSDAIREMNRYTRNKLVLGDAAAAAVRVSGIFRVGESADFALALSNTYALKAVREGDSFVIRAAAPESR